MNLNTKMNHCEGFSLDVMMPDTEHSPLYDNSTYFSGYSSESERNKSDEVQEDKKNILNRKRGREIEINGIILKDFMTSDDLNECVSALLRKEKQIFKNCMKKVIRYNPSGKEKEKRKRQRKNKN